MAILYLRINQWQKKPVSQNVRKKTGVRIIDVIQTKTEHLHKKKGIKKEQKVNKDKEDRQL